MNKRIYALLLTLTLAMFMTVACSNSDDENDPQNNNGEEPGETEDENNEEDMTEPDDDQNSNDNDTSNENDMNDNNTHNGANEDEEKNNHDSNVDEENDTIAEIPEPIELDERVQHPNGVTFTLENITFDEDYITVNIEVLNGRDRPIRLAEYMEEAEQVNKKGAILVDDTGYEYGFIGPEDEPRISVGANEKMTGSITFIGQLSEDANALSLTFNPEQSEDDSNTDYPKFEFEDIEIER